MKIDRKLNLVIPVYDDQDRPIYVHSMPISKEVFETYFRVLSRAYSEILTGGFGIMAGPRVTALIVKDIAKNEGRWEGPEGVERGLFAEIFRLTNVIVSGERGWETIPLDEARRRGSIDDGDFAEVENAILFFTVNSHMMRRREAPTLLESAAQMWGAQTSSLDCTAFQASLPTSIKVENIGEKAGPAPATPLSIPS